ncbi:MAG: hypothetical protein ABR520_02285, partial [Mycobacteriales bacterium]
MTTADVSSPAARPRRIWDRTPLRIKLVATLLLVVAAALAIAAGAAATSLRSYLLRRVDDQLTQA